MFIRILFLITYFIISSCGIKGPPLPPLPETQNQPAPLIDPAPTTPTAPAKSLPKKKKKSHQ